MTCTTNGPLQTEAQNIEGGRNNSGPFFVRVIVAIGTNAPSFSQSKT